MRGAEGHRYGQHRDRGLTLLEVMVAMAILALSMTSLMASQMASIRATRYAQHVTAIAFLAEYQLIEVEYVMRKEGGWVLEDKIYEGNFAQQGWGEIRYKCVVDFIEIPEYGKLRSARDRSMTLYSLRHTFIDRLKAVEAPRDVQEDLMGHVHMYGEGTTLDHRHRWLQRIAFDPPCEI